MYSRLFKIFQYNTACFMILDADITRSLFSECHSEDEYIDRDESLCHVVCLSPRLTQSRYMQLAEIG